VIETTTLSDPKMTYFILFYSSKRAPKTQKLGIDLGPKKGRTCFRAIRKELIMRDHFLEKKVKKVQNAVTNNSPILKEKVIFLDYTLGSFSEKKAPI